MTPRKAILSGLIGAILFSAAAEPAMAHVAIDGADDFTAGLLHPFFVLTHVLVLVGLGLFLAQQAFASAKLALAGFVVALIGGFAAGALDLGGLVPTRGVLLAAALTVGLLVAWARAQRRAIALILAAVIGAAVGIDSVPEEGELWSILAGLAGTGLSVSLLLVNVLALASHLTRHWQRIGMRVIGSWIGASALMVTALTMR